MTVTFTTGVEIDPVEFGAVGVSVVIGTGGTLLAIAAIAAGLITALPVLMIVGPTAPAVALEALGPTKIFGTGGAERPVEAAAGLTG